jgi:hypothetical protein
MAEPLRPTLLQQTSSSEIISALLALIRSIVEAPTRTCVIKPLTPSQPERAQQLHVIVVAS